MFKEMFPFKITLSVWNEYRMRNFLIYQIQDAVSGLYQIRFRNCKTKLLTAILVSMFLNELRGFQQASFPAQEILLESPLPVCVMLSAFHFATLYRPTLAVFHRKFSPFSPPTVRRINFGWIQGQHKLSSTFLSQQSSCAEHETPPPHVLEPFFFSVFEIHYTAGGWVFCAFLFSDFYISIQKYLWKSSRGKKIDSPPPQI